MFSRRIPCPLLILVCKSSSSASIMPFHPPSWAPKVTQADIPDDLSLTDFVFSDQYRPHSCESSPKPFVDSIKGHGYSVEETRRRVEWLAAGLAAHVGMEPMNEEVWDRVVSVFTVNNVRQGLPR